MAEPAPKENRRNGTQSTKRSPADGGGDAIRWRCLNCGQHVFVIAGLDPPDICAYCSDMTTWQMVDN